MNTDKIEGCILGGAIGDAWGSGKENQTIQENDSTLFYWGGGRDEKEPEWQLTDDTQLTLATLESIIEKKGIFPEHIAANFVKWHQKGRLSGLGASTLKAIRELSMGGHWALVGRKGEHAAGNGAAMRIAPLAFQMNPINNQLVRDVSRITHHSEEAYAGALAIIICLNQAFYYQWNGDKSILDILLKALPDSLVRDRIEAIFQTHSQFTIQSFAQKYGCSGYVAESVPLAIFAALKLSELGFEEVLRQLIEVGGDTDTNCSMAGQIMGAILGKGNLPKDLLAKLEQVRNYEWIEKVVNQFGSLGGL